MTKNEIENCFDKIDFYRSKYKSNKGVELAVFVNELAGNVYHIHITAPNGNTVYATVTTDVTEEKLYATIVDTCIGTAKPHSDNYDYGSKNYIADLDDYIFFHSLARIIHKHYDELLTKEIVKKLGTNKDKYGNEFWSKESIEKYENGDYLPPEDLKIKTYYQEEPDNDAFTNFFDYEILRGDFVIKNGEAYAPSEKIAEEYNNIFSCYNLIRENEKKLDEQTISGLVNVIKSGEATTNVAVEFFRDEINKQLNVEKQKAKTR